MRVIVNWAASCGGCDVSLLDNQNALDFAQNNEVLYWPVAVDFKHKDLEEIEDGSVDIGIINGGIRTSEQEEEAKIVREKCKILVSYGACACLGGIPGLANQFDRNDVLNRAYGELGDSEEFTIPQPRSEVDGIKLTLPEFYDSVRPLDEVVEVDYYVPGCPPSQQTIDEFLTSMPDSEKKVFASDKSLCYECPRYDSRNNKRLDNLYRPHEITPDDRCLLEQGVVCLGFATRGGCGARCVNVNMPCRGCYGTLPSMVDPGDAMSALASIAGEWEDYTPPAMIHRVLDAVKDTTGVFYMFSLPQSLINKLKEKGKEEGNKDKE
ncbi:MAG: oxidoreductase [Archaeoglobaceae archaeon]